MNNVLRWLFLFLVLANVLLLFWFSTFVVKNERVGPESKIDLHEIKLLTEVDKSVLRLKEGSRSESINTCLYFSYFPDLKVVNWLLGESRAQGLEVRSLKETIDESFYLLKVDLKSDPEQQRLLSLYLRETRGLEVSVEELGIENRYVIGRFAQRAEAEKELQELVISGVAAYLVYEADTEERYKVVVYQESGRKLSSEIKELVEKRYSDIKIVKKVCEGVASPWPTE